jgi:nucleoside triphosphate diphosphatase
MAEVCGRRVRSAARSYRCFSIDIASGFLTPEDVNFWGNRRNDSITFMATGAKFERVKSIMARLRAPGGCPWDREQTFDTIKRYTLEETYEVLEAIDNRDWKELTGELGDLLLQVLFYAEMAEEQGSFTIDDVLDALSNKLIYRHPHVFGDTKADDAAQVLKNWEALKAEEKRKSLLNNGETLQTGPAPLLEGVSSKMPALQEAHKISSKAAHVGFDWPEIQGLFEKLTEETRELQEHLGSLPAAGSYSSRKTEIPAELREHIEAEVGDLFFVLVNIARYLSVDPESALRKTNRKFRRRFGWMEEQLREQGRTLEQATLEEMEALWQQAKTLEVQKP